ncbi:hypothetical protein J0656_19555 [Muricauda ruestringensis]|uniref:Uncharacterized protein n=1 Tax=Flagellimonas aurea TaxID=2915619 RepID=A0ABS3G9W5_9FLAO|nr:hypothetical protein [Allomuricauda aurea]MBO0356223.1 hypothetical protein [Allomuricauda aurea]
MFHENIPDRRDGRSAEGRTTTTTAPQHGRILQGNETAKGCRSNTGRHRPLRSRFHVADGFLKGQFLPRLCPSRATDVPSDPEQREAECHHSLALLCRYYGIRPMATRHFGFPYNVELALWEVQGKLQDDRYGTRVSLMTEDEKWYITTTQTYGTGTVLFYIPVIPLYLLLRDKKRKHQGQLLQCVFAYLLHIGIPFYRGAESFLHWQYEIIGEWLLENPEEWEREDFHGQASQWRAAQVVGDWIEKKIRHPILLQGFQKRMDAFVPTDENERECHRVAKKFYALYRDFPNGNVFAHARGMGISEEDDETVWMDQYISFVADARGDWLSKQVKEGVNAIFNECTQMQNPTIIRAFRDIAPKERDTLGFESRLFPLLEQLIQFLTEVK